MGGVWEGAFQGCVQICLSRLAVQIGGRHLAHLYPRSTPAPPTQTRSTPPVAACRPAVWCACAPAQGTLHLYPSLPHPCPTCSTHPYYPLPNPSLNFILTLNPYPQP